MSLSAHSLLQNLKFSDRPAERAAQVRLLSDVFTALEQRRLIMRAEDWSSLSEVAAAPAIAETVDEMVRGLHADPDFGSFDELKARRDDTGAVRLSR